MTNKKRFKTELINKENGFIVQTLHFIFYWLERISLFHFIRWLARNDKDAFVNSYMFSEIWTVGNLIFAGFISLNLIKYSNCICLTYILLIYAIFRILEMLVYQINALFFHRLNSKYIEIIDDKKDKDNIKNDGSQLLSATRTVILLIFNVFEYIIQFSVIFAAISVINGLPVLNIGFIQSFELFMSLADIEVYMQPRWLFVVAYLEVLIGIFMNLLCLARFIGILPGIKTKSDI